MPTSSELQVNVAEILHKPGVDRPLEGAWDLAGLEILLAKVTGPVHADLMLEGVMEGLVVAGSVSAEVTLQCRRCLEEKPETVEATISELFSDDPVINADDDVYSVDGVEIDLEQVLRDAILLVLPSSPLLCLGDPSDCPNRGEVSEEGRVELAGRRTDPRWSELNKLFDESHGANSSANGTKDV